jgi:hypothetical protein
MILEDHWRVKQPQVLEESALSLRQEGGDSHNLVLVPSHVSMSMQQRQWHQVRMVPQTWQMTLWMKLISSAQL